jgi:hypothetical protein
MLNEQVMAWALTQAAADAKNTYQAIGTQYRFENDAESMNGGLWIYESLDYKVDKTQNTVTL